MARTPHVTRVPLFIIIWEANLRLPRPSSPWLFWVTGIMLLGPLLPFRLYYGHNEQPSPTFILLRCDELSCLCERMGGQTP